MEIQERIRFIINFKIRSTKPQDVHSLPEIERSAGETFRSLPALAWIAEDEDLSADAHLQYALHGASWVAEVQGQLVGFLCASVMDENLHIEELSVRQEWQGKGIGHGLMNTVIQHARAHGFRSLTLTTFREVPWNGPFYRALGFEIIPAQELEPWLRDILDDEIKRGFSAEMRCAMRFLMDSEKGVSLESL